MDTPAKVRILIADDNREFRLLLKEVLAEAGFAVDEAPDGEACVRALFEAQPSARAYSVVVSDVRMPRQSGVDIARLVRERWPEVRVILISAFHDALSMDLAFDLGIDAFLSKPFDLTELIRIVNRVRRAA